jgi:hypothetical protein
VVAYGFLPDGDQAARRCFVEAGQSFEVLVHATLVRPPLEDPASAAHLRELLARGAPTGVAPDPVPIIPTTADDRVVVGVVDGDGSPWGLIVTEGEVTRAWAEETVDESLARDGQIRPGGPGRPSGALRRRDVTAEPVRSAYGTGAPPRVTRWAVRRVAVRPGRVRTT